MSTAVETRTFGIRIDEVTAIDRWVEAVGARWGESEETVFAARLCLAELAGNVLEHGPQRSDDDHVIIMLSRLSDGVGIEFLDSCAAFDPTATLVASGTPHTNDGGRGLKLLRAYANELSYSHDGTYNRVRLKIKSA